MPKITQYTQQNLPNQMIQASASGIAPNALQGAADLANVVGQINTKLQEVEYYKMLPQIELENIQRSQELSQAEIDLSQDYSQVYSRDFEQRTASLNIPPAMQERWAVDKAKLQTSFARQGIQEQARRAGVKAETDFVLALNDSKKLVKMDSRYIGAAKEAIRNQINAMPALSPQDKEELFLTKALPELEAAEIEGLIERDARGADRVLTIGKFSTGNISFDDFANELFRIEGGYVEDDAGAGQTIFGINESANKAEFAQIMELVNSGKEKQAKNLAKQVAKKKYWDAIDADNLDPRLAFIAADAAFNQGVGAAKEMLKKSGGDINKFIELRKERYIQTAKNPQKAQYLNGWLNRVDEMQAFASGSVLSPEVLAKYKEVARSTIEIQEAQEKKDLIASREADIQTKIQNEDKLLELLDSAELSFDEKIAKVNEFDLGGGIRDEFATEARAYLKSQNEITAQTNTQVMADFITRMYDVNAAAEDSPQDYLLGVSNIRQEILSARNKGELSKDDAVKLNNQIKTLMSAKISDATKEVAYNFSRETRSIIENALPPEYRSEAIRELFYQTYDPETSGIRKTKQEKKTIQEAYKDKAFEVIDSINAKRRERAQGMARSLSVGGDTPVEDVEALLERTGYTMSDVEETAKNKNITTEAVLNWLRVNG